MGGQGSGNHKAKGQKGNKGGGRAPLFGQPMTRQIAVKLNAEQLAWLDQKAAQAGIKPSTLIRDLIAGVMAAKGYSGIYVMPTLGHVQKFVKARVEPRHVIE